MRYIHTILSIIILALIFGLVAVYAQEDCEVATSEVLDIVGDICSILGDNQVCYGNYKVGTDVLDDEDVPDFAFSNPGDLANLEYIRSIYLSALDPEENTWGIAQMLLLVATSSGVQDLNMILFGDVEVENAVEKPLIVEVQVGVSAANIRNKPVDTGLVLQSVSAGTLLEAIGRLEDNSWVRVRTDSGAVGWIAGILVQPIHEDEMIDDLEIQDSSSSYFGPMQAFYFNQGAGSACNNVTADGLIIQTPQGPASVNISINGVYIDLQPSKSAVSAYITGSDSDMSITLISGSASVTADGTQYYLTPGQQTTISIGPDGNPTSAPSAPTDYDQSLIDGLPNLPYVSPIIPISIADVSVDGLVEVTEEAPGNSVGTVIVSSPGSGGGGQNGSTSCELNTNSAKACGTTGNSNGNGNGSGGNGNGSG